MEVFKGYCYTEDGRQLPPIDLEQVEEAVDFLKFHANLYHRVVVTDVWDTVVAEIRDGKIIHHSKNPGRDWRIREKLNIPVRADLLVLLEELSEETLIPQSELMDEAIDALLRKHGKLG